MERGKFIDFLYANLTLKSPPGMEGQVYEMKAYKSPNHITGFYQFTPEELAEINKVGGCWLSFMARSWPPVGVHAMLPALRPVDNLLLFDKTPERVQLLQYLDLNLILVLAPEEEGSFTWGPPSPGPEGPDGKPLEVWDLLYRVKTRDEATGAMVETGLQGGKYLFSERLEILGRFKDLERLHPLKLIFPGLTEEVLCLMQADPPPPPPKEEPRIITLYQ
jgi:hypothetical protein